MGGKGYKCASVCAHGGAINLCTCYCCAANVVTSYAGNMCRATELCLKEVSSAQQHFACASICVEASRTPDRIAGWTLRHHHNPQTAAAVTLTNATANVEVLCARF